MAAMRRVYAIGKPTQATKAALLLSSALANTLERHQSLCVEGNGTIDCHKLMDYKRQVLGPFPKMLSAMFESMGIEFVPEFGKLADEYTVQAGVTLSEAEANADAYRIDEWHYGPFNEWVDNRELDINITLVLDNDGHLVGAAIYGAEAGTWIDFLALVINTKLTAADIRKMIFAFPTQTYMLASHLAQVLAAR